MRCGERRVCRARTVAFYLAVDAFDYAAEVGPFREVLEVEAYVIGFGEGVEVGGCDAEEVWGAHGADCGHFWGSGRFAGRGIAVDSCVYGIRAVCECCRVWTYGDV